MHKVLNETIADKKADAGFEQRMISRFRDRVPKRPGLVQLVMNLVRLRAVQLTAAAALLLSMVQMGRMITGESMTPTARRENALTIDESGFSKTAPGARRDATTLAAKTDTRRPRRRPVRSQQLGSGFGSIGATARTASTGQTGNRVAASRHRLQRGDAVIEQASTADKKDRGRRSSPRRTHYDRAAEESCVDHCRILPQIANLSETRRRTSRSLASKTRFRKSRVSPRKRKATSRPAVPRNRRTAS